jgi:hypothetical protein
MTSGDSNRRPNGIVYYDHLGLDTGDLKPVSKPVWITGLHMIKNGMNFHTHRHLFRQLQAQLGFAPASLKIETDEGIRVYSLIHHRSILEQPLQVHLPN